jgi:hypothetical protein
LKDKKNSITYLVFFNFFTKILQLQKGRVLFSGRAWALVGAVAMSPLQGLRAPRAHARVRTRTVLIGGILNRSANQIRPSLIGCFCNAFVTDEDIWCAMTKWKNKITVSMCTIEKCARILERRGMHFQKKFLLAKQQEIPSENAKRNRKRKDRQYADDDDPISKEERLKTEAVYVINGPRSILLT